MSNAFAGFEPSPEARSFLNIGFPFTIATGSIKRGYRGEPICNGGMQHFTGVAGAANLYKSTIAHGMHLAMQKQYYEFFTSMLYDTEPPSCSFERMAMLGRRFGLTEDDIRAKLFLTDSTVMMGNKWFKAFRDWNTAKSERSKKERLTLPWPDRNGKPITVPYPDGVEVDSLSMMQLDVVEKIFDENEVGDSGANIEAMKGQAAKTQMIIQIPTLITGTNTFLTMTAHIGKTYQLDPRTPPTRYLTFLKSEAKLKNVPEKFTFLTNNLWMATGGTVLKNATTKAPEFPRGPEDDLTGDTDLMVIALVNLRAKNGPSGLPVEIVVSQNEGWDEGLSALLYLRQYKDKAFGEGPGWGMGGHDRSYYLDLYPECKLQRTTVRGKMEEDRRLKRAMVLSAEICQIRNIWHHIPKDKIPTMAELYTKLKEKGYSWDKILDSRPWWSFDEQKLEKNYCWGMTLIEIYNGELEWPEFKA